MKCPKCQTEDSEAKKFCRECGAKLALACPKCEAETFPNDKFCSECGHDLTLPSEPTPKDLSFEEKLDKIQRYLPKGLAEKILSQRDKIEGERKQVTVMFCDMEGFTQLTETLGPEEAYAIMDQVYEKLIHSVHEYEGTVNEMTGDGIVALFGAPIALEDAPQRAVRSALAIHRSMAEFNTRLKEEKREMPPLKMRIGVHTGPVVVGTLGNDLRVEFKAVGDTVNLASRMEDLAEPGTCYVTEETFKLTEGFFRFEGLGKKTIKGKEEPVKVYRVIATSTRRTRFEVGAERGLTPFVGRDRELEILLDGFERVKAGRGQAFSIVADAGVGKSRLLYEFRKAVSSEDATFLEGRCLSYSRDVGYHPIIDTLKANFDIREGDKDSGIRRKVKEGLKVLGVDEASTLPYLLELLSVKDSGIDKIPMSPEMKKVRIIEALKQIVLKGSEMRPLVMAIEDLYWVDKSSEEVLKALLESIPGARILLLFTYRPTYVHTWGAKSYHSQLNLNRLANRESLAMVTHLLGTEEIPEDLAELILEKTEGIPFFIEEFVKSLKDLKIIEHKDDKYHLAKGVEEVTIPSTIQDVITARIDSLPEGAKEVLQTGSAIEREFSYEVIKEVTSLPEQELLSCLSALKDAELVYEKGIYPQSTYIFKHALTRDVAYGSLLLKRKKEIHEKTGSAIERIYSERLEEYYELLAFHYMRSENVEKALKHLCLANQKAIDLHALEEAKGYFDEAMKCLDSLPDTEENQRRRVSLLGNQGAIFRLLFREREIYPLLNKHEDLAISLNDAELLGPYYSSMASCEFGFGMFDQAVGNANKAAELCEATGNMEGATHAYFVLMWSVMFKGDYGEVLRCKERLLRATEEGGDFFWYAWALSAVSFAYSCQGLWKEALQAAKDAVSIAQKHTTYIAVLSVSSWVATIAYASKGEVEKAFKFAELAVREAATPAEEAWSQTHLALAWCRSGEAERSVQILSQLDDNYRTVQFMPSVFVNLFYLGQAYWQLGQEEKASETLDDVVEIAEQCGAKYYLGAAHRLLGEITLKTNPTEAEAHFEKSISTLQEIKAENELALAYAGYGRFYKQQGNVEQAKEYLTKALEIFERLGTLIEPEKVREELSDLPKG